MNLNTVESILLFFICLIVSLFIVRLFFMYLLPAFDKKHEGDIKQIVGEISEKFLTQREATEKILGSRLATALGGLIACVSQISLVYLLVYSPICFWIFLAYLALGLYKTRHFKLPQQASFGARIMARIFYATIFPLINYS